VDISPVICSILAELFSRFSFTLPFDIFHRNVAVLAAISISPSRPVTDTSPFAPNDVEFHFVEEAKCPGRFCTAWSPAALSPGVENDHIAGESNLGLGLPIVLIGVALTLRAHRVCELPR